MFGYLEVKTKILQNRPNFLLSPKYKNQHAFDEARHQSLLNKKCPHISKCHSLKISSESMRVEETYEILAISYHKMKKIQSFISSQRLQN